MDIALTLIAFLSALIGIIGCIAPILPGPALSFVGLLCAYACSYTSISTQALWWWLAATIVVSVADYFLPAYMTKLLGGSRAGQIGATLGLVVGMFLSFSIVGILLGPFFGAVLGELTHNRNETARAFRIGFGSFISFVVGTGVKLVVTVMIFAVIAADTYPVARDWVVSLF
ncbi:MAG: DUF456 domain-containing protein [Alistipes sp.]